MRARSIKIAPGMTLWLVQQFVNALESPYIVDAIVAAEDASVAIDRLVTFAKGMEWPWGCARQLEEVALEPSLLKATRLGTTTARGLKFEHGVITFRIGVDSEAIDGRLEV